MTYKTFIIDIKLFNEYYGNVFDELSVIGSVVLGQY